MSNKAAGRQWAGLRGTVGGLVVALAVASAATAQQDLGTATVAGGKALANQFNNPTSPMTLLQLRDVIAPAWNASEGSANLLEAEFVFPIEQGRLIHVMQLSRLTLPYEWVPDPQGGVAGFGDISYFDIGLIPTKWGRWGPGVSLVIPSGASTTALTAGKWQLGPAMAVILTSVPDLQFGLVLQNPISFAGPSERPDVNALTIQPTLTYNFEGGWFAGLSDFSLSFDWTDGGAATIPIGVQAGKVVSLGKRHFVLSAEGGKLVSRASDMEPEWLIGLEAAWVINVHPAAFR